MTRHIGVRRSHLATGAALAVVAASLVATAPAHAVSGDLFFSEYVEGSSNNKAVEIYNGTGAPVDLSAYSVKIAFNGATTFTSSIPLTGTLAAGDVFVVANSSASTAVTDQADLKSGSLTFNGDDAVVLFKGTSQVDVIGQIGFDPGSEWGTGNASTADNTLRRKTSVTAGDPDGTDAFDPSVQWNGFATDTFDGLGLPGDATTGNPGGGGDPSATDCTAPYTDVHDIQGSGTVSPKDKQTVVTQGVVTSDFQAPGRLSGVGIQSLTPDGDPATSEGVFVFGSALPALSVGDVVRLTGTVSEFRQQTEVTYKSGATLCGTAAVPAPAAVTLPEQRNGDLERYEGMLVSVTGEGGAPLTVEQNYFLGRYGQLTLGAGGRLYQPTNEHPAGSPEAVAQADLNARSLIVLDDASTSQNPSPIPYVGADGVRRAGDTVTGLTGMLDEGPINTSTTTDLDYRIEPTTAPTFSADNPRTDAPAPVGGNLKVASFNVLNYFTTYPSVNPDARGANNDTEFTRQRTKIFAAMKAIDADVFGLMEIENLPGTDAVGNLVSGLNEYVGQPGKFAALTEPAGANTGDDAIKVAMIYQPARVAPVGDSMRDNAAINDRPPLAQEFRLLADGETVDVVVNHLKSKGSCPSASSDPANADSGDGQGCWNARRRAQAAELLTFIDQVKQTTGEPDVLAIGDFNSYGQEDPILDLRAGGLVNEIESRIGPKGYSYVFDGMSGYLDHGLASASADRQVSGVAEWHINADEPSVIDYNTEFKTQDLYQPTPYRSSDHDPVVLGVDLGRCQFSDDAATRTTTLLGDCSTSATVHVRDGWTLDGAGHTISAYDPAGGHFTGAVVANAGRTASVRGLTVTGYHLADVCDGGDDRLRGILLDGASGTVSGNRVVDLRQGDSGCQEGTAIEVRNVATGAPGVTVTVADNTVTGYQKAGIVLNGAVVGTVTGNTVRGQGPVGWIAQNGVQVGYGASAVVDGNTIADNWYTGPDTACGLLLYQADGVKQRRNTFSGNEQDLCNVGRGGGTTTAG